MKYTLRIPTKDQYAYLEAVEDFDTPEAAFEAYTAISATVRGENGEGLPVSDWNRVIDGILAGTGKLAAEEWEVMNEKQRWFLNELKKSKNRK